MATKQLFAVLALLASSAAVGTARAESPCDLGLSALERSDDVTAFIALEKCLEGNPADTARVAAKKGLRAVTERLRTGDYAEVSLAIEPEAADVRIEGLAVAVPAQGTIFLPLGTHQLRAAHLGFQDTETVIDITDRARQTIVLRLSKGSSTAAKDPGVGNVNFDEDPPPALPPSRPQEAAEFESLIPDKFARGRPTGAPSDQERAARWPWAIVGVGVALGVAGAVTQIRGNQRAAVGLYIGGATTIAGGALTLALLRPDNTTKSDPAFASQTRTTFWVAFSGSF